MSINLQQKQAEYMREYYQDNKEKILEQSKRWNRDHEEQRRQRYQDNKEELAERSRKCYQDNKEAIRRQQQEYCLAHKKEIKEYMREYYLIHKEAASKRLKKARLERPWMYTFVGIKKRCNNPNDKSYKYYGGRGVKCLITEDEIKTLYVRDNARDMKRPSIDRIYNDGNYVFSNCRFIELAENSRKGHRERRDRCLRSGF